LERRRSQSGGIRQRLGVIRFRQIQFGIVQVFALRQVVVVRITHKTGAHPTHQGFGKAVENVERGDCGRTKTGMKNGTKGRGEF